MIKDKVASLNLESGRSWMPATLWRLFRDDRGKVLGALFFTTVKHVPFLVTPVITANIINCITNPGPHPLRDLAVNALVLLVLVLQNIPTFMIASRFISKVVRDMEAAVRGALVRRIQFLSIGFHDRFRSGRLQSKILVDVEALVRLSRQLLNSVLMSLLNVIFAVAVTLLRKPEVALFYLVTIPLAVGLIRLFRGRMSTRNRYFRSEVESMSARVAEMVEMIPITRAHGVEDFEIAIADSQLAHVKTAGHRLDMLNALFASSTWVTMQVFQLLCLVVTGYMAFRGMIPIGDVVMYQGFFAMIVNSANHLLSIYPELARGAEAVRSVNELLQCDDVEANTGKRVLSSVRGRYSFEHVSFTYPAASTPAIRDFSLHIDEGTCVAFVGGSGAGKSTLLNLIIGFRRPDSGRILLDGVAMQSLDLRSYRRHIAVVTQDIILFSGTIRDNITYGMWDVEDKKLYEAIEMANAAEFIDALPEGPDTIIGERGKTLSGGQQQRIAIARALIRNPRVIILDEATSSLDVVSEALVQEAIERLVRNRTTFIVAHRLSTIRHADRIVVVKNGRCVEEGSHDELMRRESEYYRLKALQV